MAPVPQTVCHSPDSDNDVPLAMPRAIPNHRSHGLPFGTSHGGGQAVGVPRGGLWA